MLARAAAAAVHVRQEVQWGADFTTLDELRRLITRYPGAGDGVVRDVGSCFEVYLHVLTMPRPGVEFRGTLPKTPDAETFIKSKGWCWM